MSAVPGGAAARLPKEWAAYLKAPVAGTEAALGRKPSGEENPFEWVITAVGPAEYTVAGASRPCPYAGARFNFSLKFPETYPFAPPLVVFNVANVHHPNIGPEDGQLCENAVGAMWGPVKKAVDVIRLVLQLLAAPSMEHVTNDIAAAAMTSDIAKYETDARAKASRK